MNAREACQKNASHKHLHVVADFRSFPIPTCIRLHSPFIIMYINATLEMQLNAIVKMQLGQRILPRSTQRAISLRAKLTGQRLPVFLGFGSRIPSLIN